MVKIMLDQVFRSYWDSTELEAIFVPDSRTNNWLPRHGHGLEFFFPHFKDNGYLLLKKEIKKEKLTLKNRIIVSGKRVSDIFIVYLIFTIGMRIAERPGIPG
jgi:hypothetical protein